MAVKGRRKFNLKISDRFHAVFRLFLKYRMLVKRNAVTENWCIDTNLNIVKYLLNVDLNLIRNRNLILQITSKEMMFKFFSYAILNGNFVNKIPKLNT
jgi:hypothetical protein